MSPQYHLHASSLIYAAVGITCFGECVDQADAPQVPARTSLLAFNRGFCTGADVSGILGNELYSHGKIPAQLLRQTYECVQLCRSQGSRCRKLSYKSMLGFVQYDVAISARCPAICIIRCCQCLSLAMTFWFGLFRCFVFPSSHLLAERQKFQGKRGSSAGRATSARACCMTCA